LGSIVYYLEIFNIKSCLIFVFICVFSVIVHEESIAHRTVSLLRNHCRFWQKEGLQKFPSIFVLLMGHWNCLLKFNPNFYYVSMIIVLKVQKDCSIRTKVITRKPFFLQKGRQRRQTWRVYCSSYCIVIT
jgi:hypothetical protein